MKACLRVLALFLLPLPSLTASADDLTAANTAAYVANLREAEAKGKAQEWSESAALWQKVVQVNPTDADYWGKLGTAHYNAKEYGKAIPAYEKAVELGDGFPFTSAYNIACCYALSGDKSKALDWLDRSMKMGFRDLEHVRTDNDLVSLREDPRFKEWAAVVDPTKLSRDDGWRYDLKLLARELKRLHYTLRKGAPAAFDALAAKLNADIPNLSDAQIQVGFMRLGRMANDGHTSVGRRNAKRAPVSLFLFREGVFITAAAPEQKDLVGAQVIRIGDHPVAKALESVEPLVSRDNSMGVLGLAPFYLTSPTVLNGLGLISEIDAVPMTVLAADGKERTVKIKAKEGRPDDTWISYSSTLPAPQPLYLKNRSKSYWYEYLPESKTVFCQYNAVQNDLRDPFEKFCSRMFKFIDENDVKRLVLDLRWNGGGNTFLTQPLVHGLIKCDKINKKGSLFVITGRHTFSAAQNCSVFIERNSKAIFVGEPTGSSPNFVGETVILTLPYSKMVASISDLYWQSSWPMDYRTWIAPELYAPPTFELYRANRDPAMEAIAAYPTS